MNRNRIRSRGLALLLVCALVLSLAGCAAKQEDAATAETGDYAAKLFDTSYVHTIDVTISDADWADLTANPLDKTKYAVDVTIDGETITDVSFATKGNTSLSSVAQDADSDRYSFKVNFGKFVDGQTYYGLNKLNLNNIYADATYMKDYLSYEIFRQAGVAAPLTSYVWLTINGEAHGLYIAIEDISESYLDRTEDGEGVLYKPETEQLANQNDAPGGMNPSDGAFDGAPELPDGVEMPDMQPGGGQDAEMPQPDGQARGGMGGPRPDMGDQPEDMELPDDMVFPDDAAQPGGGMGFGEQANGADLVYTDDALDSYSDIFDNAVTDAEDADMERVVAALKGLSEGGDLAAVLDTDATIRYFAAHNFVLNYDSYTGNMLHNYYLYENDGGLSMLPWDYNLAFGAFAGGEAGGSDATALVNTGIDTPLSGATEDSRPMWSWIVSDETYLEQYHAVYDTLLADYFESGAFSEEIDALYEMLLPYVERDPSAFYTADEFTTAVETLKAFCLLRAESIRAQLDGALATETDAQDESAQIDASAVDIRGMGSQDMGKENGAPQPGERP